jgi:hypothetical protein
LYYFLFKNKISAYFKISLLNNYINKKKKNYSQIIFFDYLKKLKENKNKFINLFLKNKFIKNYKITLLNLKFKLLNLHFYYNIYNNYILKFKKYNYLKL